MQRLMLNIDGAVRRHRKLVLTLWAIVLVAALPLAAKQTSDLTGGGFEDPQSQSTAVSHAVARDFPSVGNAGLSVVLQPHPQAGGADLEHAIARVNSELTGVRGVRVDSESLQGVLAGARLSPHQPVVLPLHVSGNEMNAIDTATTLRSKLGIEGGTPGHVAEGRVDVHLVGQGAIWAAFQQQAKADSKSSEAKAFPAIAILLLLAFGSFAGMMLPLGLGAAAVVMTGAVIYLLSQITTMSLYVTNTASLIGIGVAVDYSLFVLARYREEVKAGRSNEQARAVAVATSGVAVMFSALTVITAQCGIFLINSTAMRSIAAGAMVVVAMSALSASILLPVLISFLGDRAHEPGRLALAMARWRARRGGPPRLPFWERWAHFIMRHAVLSVIASTSLLLILAYPALHLKMANHALSQLPREHEIRKGTRIAGEVLGAGATGPVLITVGFNRGTATSAVARHGLVRLKNAILSEPGVSYVVPPLISADRRTAELTTVLAVDPESQAAHNAIERLRARLPAVFGSAAVVHVGGTTAVLMDFDSLVSRSLWKIILFILTLTFFVLMVLLRSIVLPIKAVIMNLLSVAAAYGALVAVFQWGWLEFLGLQKVPSIESISPPLILVITFGLSMDYEIFLLTRIRERYLKTGDNRTAVAEGLASSARTITSAALIMIVVCIAFLGSGLGALQRLGLATAVAIGVDATIVRLVLVPGAMTLLGRWNWWMPARLARRLPAAHAETLEVELEPVG